MNDRPDFALDSEPDSGLNTAPDSGLDSAPDPAPAPAPVALLRTVILACAIFLIPVMIGVFFVLVSERAAPPPPPDTAAALAQLTNRLHSGSATNIAQLADLRHDMRQAGLATDEIDLMIWAARATEPERLFHIPPPATSNRWEWHLSQDGLHVLAVSDQRDDAERCSVGLYDLTGECWVWTNSLPWPETHESPHVFNRHVVMRYIKNATRFAMEINPQGKIISIDRLGSGRFTPTAPVASDPRFDGYPVGAKNGVFFIIDPADHALCGYAQSLLPGLRNAGSRNATTVFSGNGLLKFIAANGRVAVVDSLTQNVLQTFNIGAHSSNSVVTAMQASLDGSALEVFLKTEFPGASPVQRTWSLAIDTYAGTAKKNLKVDEASLPAAPTNSLTTLSPDNRWRLSVDRANILTIESADAARTVARVPLAPNLRAPVRSIAFLEDGRHLAILQERDAWLLDFTVARAYGGLMARAATCSRTISLETYLLDRGTNRTEEADAQLAISSEGYGIEESFMFDDTPQLPDTTATAPAFLALRAEQLVANQAWGYAAAMLEETARLQASDPRAPRINPLLLARCQLLSGQAQKARVTSRDALRTLLARPVYYDLYTGQQRPARNTDPNDNRMIRYHLQHILFAPQ